MKKISIQLLLTGDELMAGDIVDSNSAFLAHALAESGLSIARKVTVGDDLTLLTEEISAISKSADILIINGGLGPTVDDLTAQALAQSMDTSIEQHSEALTQLSQWCEKRGAQLSPANLKQTMLPKGVDIVKNEIGSAPGFMTVLNGCTIFCTPGVPRELKLMMHHQIMPQIVASLPQAQKTNTIRLQVFGMGESQIQELLSSNIPDWPEQLSLGFRAGLPSLEVKVTAYREQDNQLQQTYVKKIAQLLGDHLFNYVDEKPLSLQEVVLNLLADKGYTLTTAESCTGGLIASQITSIAGASQNFHAGFVTYANESKQQLVNVNATTLAEYGAVSEQTVKEMALGAISTAKADVAVAVSGIAGPDGGSEEKPVGTVCIAWGSASDMRTITLLIPGNRVLFQKYVASIALDLIRRFLRATTSTPTYVTQRQVKKEVESL
ncbi:CinA family nicotinamide mononucleotide deamidase-related protein [Thalassotalea agarivorans]|uniref:CinA-like protein n=1 Tax=Thalassotalea agarivorans TaxID=349064 RepID=A0A1I0HIJ3_THASX|nr:CinA family nicotinamide mononucleotide deamidase-related protein [Thalassotalea agarivorans]SET83525.1 nicotinamide-nucleotide amidase [Thalassotalea agarivorans]